MMIIINIGFDLVYAFCDQMINYMSLKGVVDIFIISLPQHLQDVVTGKLLGDATALLNASQTKAQLKIAQGGQGSYTYVLYCFVVLTGIVSGRFISFYQKYDKRTKKTYIGHSFYTNFSHELLGLVKSFYPDITKEATGLKVVPSNIWELLTPQALAFLIMDDGGSTNNRGIYISTEGFDFKSVQLLWIVLTYKYDLKVSIEFKGKGFYRLYIHKSSLATLRSHVIPYLLPIYHYKVFGQVNPNKL